MDIKWMMQSDLPNLNRRAMGIFSMFLNGLGIPDTLQEFVVAVFVTGNWDKTDGYDEITLMRMAKTLCNEPISQGKLYNRLKKKSPDFFKWQETKNLTLIDRVILHEHTTHHKTKAKYKFVGYEEIAKLFELPPGTPMIYIRQAVSITLEHYPTLQAPMPKKSRRKRPESTAKAAIRMANETIELTGSIEAANLYLEEAAKESMSEIGVRIIE